MAQSSDLGPALSPLRKHASTRDDTKQHDRPATWSRTRTSSSGGERARELDRLLLRQARADRLLLFPDLLSHSVDEALLETAFKLGRPRRGCEVGCPAEAGDCAVEVS